MTATGSAKALQHNTDSITCAVCGDELILPARWSEQRDLVVLANTPVRHIWKSVITDETNRLNYELGHLCIALTRRGRNRGTNHNHVRLETRQANVIRRGQHSGNYGCFDAVSCRGRNVLIGQLTELDNYYVIRIPLATSATPTTFADSSTAPDSSGYNRKNARLTRHGDWRTTYYHQRPIDLSLIHI